MKKVVLAMLVSTSVLILGACGMNNTQSTQTTQTTETTKSTESTQSTQSTETSEANNSNASAVCNKLNKNADIYLKASIDVSDGYVTDGYTIEPVTLEEIYKILSTEQLTPENTDLINAYVESQDMIAEGMQEGGYEIDENATQKTTELLDNLTFGSYKIINLLGGQLQ